MFDLPVIWAGIIAFVIFTYVILDGFDLGIGILFPFVPHGEARDIMMNSIAPVWDGNETWLVMGAASLYGAFPLAYSTLLPTLYIPILIMLAALIFRGVAFEFRFKDPAHKFIWDIAFSGGSMLATFAQGVILGTFVKGYGTGIWDTNAPYQWLTAFNLLSGMALMCGYALLGSTWLIGKTSGDLQQSMYKYAKILLPMILIFIGIVSIWTPLISPFVWQRWFSLPNFFYILPLPLMTVFLTILALRLLFIENERWPFILVILIFLCCYIGFCISAWPYIVPRSLTIWQAAAAPSSLKFVLVGAVILLPVLITYTIYSYHIFKGKITGETGYH